MCQSYNVDMSNVTRIHTDKTPVRFHYIKEWAERRNLKQADIVAATGANKGLVSRWFKGVLPGQDYLAALAALFEIEPAALFRHPEDDWLTQFFRERSEADRDKAKQMLQVMFELDDAFSSSDARRR